MIQHHDGRRAEQKQARVKSHDLAPVGVGRPRRPGVQGRYGGLNRVGVGRVCAEFFVEHAQTFFDLPAVPERPVLLPEEHQLPASGHPGSATGVVEEHESQQPPGAGLTLQELAEEPAEANGLGGQRLAEQSLARARRVPFVENEVEDGHHGLQALGEIGLVGHAVGKGPGGQRG